jgi:mannose-6-phosphate isomerase-like protein (cupin superfamily)
MTVHDRTTACKRCGDPPGSERQTGPAKSLGGHSTTLPPGGMPDAAHHYVHSEMWLIREGTVQLTINGTSHVMGPRWVGFVNSNDEHGIKNVGTTPVTYFVVAVGPGADAQ